MSKIESRTITCPKCGHKGSQKVWESINVGLNPECREKIFNEEIFSWTCPHCGLQAVAPFSTLYHDMEHQFMIYYIPRRIDDQNGIGQTKGHFPLIDGYRHRIVYDIYDFKEKIAILEAGLNDMAIEFMKYLYLHKNRPQNVPDDVSYRFTNFIQGDGKPDSKKIILFTVLSKSKGQLGFIPADYEFYEKVTKEKVISSFYNLDVDLPEVSVQVIEEFMKRG